MSQGQTVSGVGRLHRGQRSLGCVGYRLELATTGHDSVVEFDPPPAGMKGEVFSLNLADGRILECEVVENSRYFLVIGDGPHPERRSIRRPTSTARFLA